MLALAVFWLKAKVTDKWIAKQATTNNFIIRILQY
jgi:hypothetical protein